MSKVVKISHLQGTFLVTQTLARTLALHSDTPIPGAVVNFSSIVANNGKHNSYCCNVISLCDSSRNFHQKILWTVTYSFHVYNP